MSRSGYSLSKFLPSRVDLTFFWLDQGLLLPARKRPLFGCTLKDPVDAPDPDTLPGSLAVRVQRLQTGSKR